MRKAYNLTLMQNVQTKTKVLQRQK